MTSAQIIEPLHQAWVHRDFLSAAGVGVGELDLLFAGPPCQGFSMIGPREISDLCNSLFQEVLRSTAALRPKAVVIENVPGLLTLGDGRYLTSILSGLRAEGYQAACAELLAAANLCPIRRSRRNCTKGFLTTRGAIGDLPVVQAGESAVTYSGRPRHEFQVAARTRLDGRRMRPSELRDHYAAALSPLTLKRLSMLAPGQDCVDIRGLEGHVRATA